MASLSEKKRVSTPRGYIDFNKLNISREGDFDITDEEEAVSVNKVRKSITASSNPGMRKERGELSEKKVSMFNVEVTEPVHPPLSARLVYPQNSRQKTMNQSFSKELKMLRDRSNEGVKSQLAVRNLKGPAGNADPAAASLFFRSAQYAQAYTSVRSK